MASNLQSKSDLNLVNTNGPAVAPASSNAAQAPPTNTQVKVRKPYTPRRSFNAAYKARIVVAYNACTSASERGALLRKEGLYLSRITSWKREFANGKFTTNTKQQAVTPRTDNLQRENELLRKKLAQAEAVIDLQKKISELFGMHILPRESSEVNS